MELSKRLQAVANLVSNGRSVADIGCDHGYVSIYLAKERLANKVIAMDVNEGPLLHAKANVQKYGMSKKIEIRLSDGTAALQPGEVDTLLISGMGGKLIMRIVEAGLDRLGDFAELILQPQSEVFLVRAFLREHGYEIVDEDFVIEDGKNYPMMKAQKADAFDVESDSVDHTIEDLFGPILLQKRPADFMTYIHKEITKTAEIIAKVTDEARKAELLEYLAQLESIANEKKNTK